MNAPLRWILAAVLVVLFGVVYAHAFRALIAHWAANDMYSYGFLVPLISIYLVWMRRAHLRTVPVIPSYGWGMFVLTCGAAMLILGRISSTNLLEWLSLPLSVWGVCLLVLGSPMTQSL